MSKLILKKAKHLEGEVDIHGAKNAALPIIAATLLTDKKCVLHSVPSLSDVENMIEILKSLGYEDVTNGFSHTIIPKKITSLKTSYEQTNKLRASFLISGPLLAKHGKVEISYPGGCQIGSRPVDLHLKFLISMIMTRKMKLII